MLQTDATLSTTARIPKRFGWQLGEQAAVVSGEPTDIQKPPCDRTFSHAVMIALDQILPRPGKPPVSEIPAGRCADDFGECTMQSIAAHAHSFGSLTDFNELAGPLMQNIFDLPHQLFIRTEPCPWTFGLVLDKRKRFKKGIQKQIDT